MKLDVRKILSGELDTLKIDYTLDSSLLPEYDDVKYMPTLKINGQLKNNAGYMRLSLVSSLEYDTVCARCLKDIHNTLDVKFEKTVCAEGDIQDRENDDYVEICDSMLDIDQVLIEYVILEFPMRNLCESDCKGLCPKCGTDLNNSKCNCITKEIDPRLAVLLKYFDTDDGKE